MSPVLLAEGDDLAGGLPLVKRVAPLLGDQAIAGGKVQILEDFACLGGPAVDQIGACGVGPLRQRLRRIMPPASDNLADREAPFGVGDGRLQQFRKAAASKPPAQLVPSVNATRD